MKAFENCPGCAPYEFVGAETTEDMGGEARPSQLRGWPIQLHLISPGQPQFQGADLLLAADCVAYAVGDFHRDHLKGYSLAIACPKLDQGLDVYEEKLRALVDESGINTLTVMIMEVPCCSGLLGVAKRALDGAERRIPLKAVVVGVQGDILTETWV